MKVTKNTAQWDLIKKNLLKNIPELNTGFFSNSSYGPENDNLPVAQVAQWNEEGSSTNPTRPFMRVGFGGVLRAGKLDKNIAAAIKRIADGESPMQSLKILGPVFVNEMKQQIIDWDSPSNSPKTIADKGFDDPLRDTDTMLNSVEYRVGSV
jgi:hypothetical protein